MKIVEIANKASKIPGIKFLLKPFYYRYKNYRNKRTTEIFLKYGKEVIQEFDNLMTSNNYPYFLIFGSLLGAVRERGFISHDLDMDTAMWYDDLDDNLLPLLEKNGFRLVKSFVVDNAKSGMEWTLEKKGIHIDVFFVYKLDNEITYCCDFPFNTEETGCVSWEQLMKNYGGIQPRRVQLPFTKNIIRTKFEEFELPILNNADEILKIHYGKDYMTPIANWSRDIEKEPPTHLVMWKGKLAMYKSNS